jgi:carbon-monoxide dehydrogenase large subunit
MTTDAAQLWAQRRWVGQRVKRVEDPRLLTGHAEYVADLRVEDVLDVAFLRSSQAHARIASIDTSACAGADGVVAVFTGHDVVAEPLVDILQMPNLIKTPRPALARDKVRFAGEPVVMVVARDRYLAEDAAEQVLVDYEALPANVDVKAAMTATGEAQLFDDVPSNVYYRTTWSTDGVDDAFGRAAHVFQRSFHTNRFMAAPMETRGSVARYERSTGELTFWTSTQCPHLVRTDLAMCLGIPEHRIRVIAPEVGGGFGQKGYLYPEDLAVAFASVTLGRPVRWIEDRQEHLLAAAHAKEQVIELEAALDDNGIILAFRGRFIGDSGAYSFGPYAGIIEPMPAATLFTGAYRVEEFAYEVVGVVTNKSPVGPYRGIGWSAGHTTREIFLDEIARALDLDRADFRRRNMVPSDAFPYQTCTGALLDSGSYVESLDLALDMAKHSEFEEVQRIARDGGRYLGMGISPFVESTAWGTKSSFESGFPAASHDNARVSVDPSGKVTVAVGVSSHGQGHETSLAQLAADILGVAPGDVAVVEGDTASVPYGMGTYASRSAVIGGGALALAAMDVRTKLLEVAASMLEAAPGDLVLEEGKVHVRGTPTAALEMREIAHAAYFSPALRDEFEDPFLSATRFYDPAATYSNGCVIATVEVDVETGLVHIRDLVAVEDCGTMLNPMIVEGQVRGGLVQGIGGALFEHLVYDDEGQPLATTYMDYLVPRATEIPPIRIGHLETPSPFTIGGVKGMAEGSSIAAPSAIINAVMDALSPFGARVSTFPLTPHAVWEAIAGGREELER